MAWRMAASTVADRSLAMVIALGYFAFLPQQDAIGGSMIEGVKFRLNHIVMITDIKRAREVEAGLPPDLKEGDIYCTHCHAFFPVERPCSAETLSVVSRQFRREHLACKKQ